MVLERSVQVDQFSIFPRIGVFRDRFLLSGRCRSFGSIVGVHHVHIYLSSRRGRVNPFQVQWFLCMSCQLLWSDQVSSLQKAIGRSDLSLDRSTYVRPVVIKTHDRSFTLDNCEAVLRTWDRVDVYLSSSFEMLNHYRNWFSLGVDKYENRLNRTGSGVGSGLIRRPDGSTVGNVILFLISPARYKLSSNVVLFSDDISQFRSWGDVVRHRSRRFESCVVVEF